jgi:hypothetical protein
MMKTRRTNMTPQEQKSMRHAYERLIKKGLTHKKTAETLGLSPNWYFQYKARQAGRTGTQPTTPSIPTKNVRIAMRSLNRINAEIEKLKQIQWTA